MNKSDKTNSEIKIPDDATSVQSLLESAIKQQLTVPELIVALKAQCRRNSDTTWQALALVDQYFRRGRISHEVFTEIKRELNSLVFSARVETRPSTSSHAASSHVTSSHVTSSHSTPNQAPSSQQSQSDSAERIAERKESQPSHEPASIKDVAPVLLEPEPASSSIEKKMFIATAIAVVVVAAFVVISRVRDVAPIAKPATTESDLTARPDVARESNSSMQAEINSPVVGEDKAAIAAESEITQSKQLDQDTNKNHSIVAVDSAKPSLLSEPVAGTTSADSTIQAHTNAAQSESPDTQSHAPTLSATTAPASEAQTTVGLSFVEDPVIVSAGESTARISVHRASSTRKELLIHWRTVEGSAKANRDFVATDDGVLVFAAGARTAAIVVPIVQRPDRQFSDWFEVELITQSAAEGRTANTEVTDQGADVRATVVIASKRTTDELGTNTESGTTTRER